MFRLDRSSRAALAGLAFAAFAAAFVTTPMGARGAAPARPPDEPPRPVATPSTFVVVAPRRDPFAFTVPPAVRTLPPAPPLPPIATIPASLVPLPPNAGAGAAPFPFAAAPARAPGGARVTAVVTGSRPFALIDEGGTTRLVTVGERVAGDAVSAITASGVRLAGGATLPLLHPAAERTSP